MAAKAKRRITDPPPPVVFVVIQLSVFCEVLDDAAEHRDR
jgi:hypothetical protein